MGTLSSERAQDTLRSRAKDKKDSIENALRFVLGTREGRIAFRWLLSSNVTGLTSSAFHADSHRAAWAEGRRSVGVEIVNAIEHVAPGSYAALVNDESVEAKEDRVHATHAEAEASREDNE